MILQCRKCWKLQEHLIFREGTSWYALCSKCANIKEINISKHLFDIGARLITSEGKIFEIIGYGNTTQANTFDEIYYVAYPIELMQDIQNGYLINRTIKVYTNDMKECVERYNAAIKEEKIMNEKEAKVAQPIITNVNNTKVMDFILYNILKSLNVDQIINLVALAKEYKDNLVSGVINLSVPDTPYTLIIGKDPENLTCSMLYITNHKTKEEFKFSGLYDQNWDIITFLENIRMDIISREHQFVRYHGSNLKDILYNEALSYDYDDLLKLDEFRKVMGVNMVSLPNNLTLSMDAKGGTIHLSIYPEGTIGSSPLQTLASEEKLTIYKIFDPWLDILIDSKLK